MVSARQKSLSVPLAAAGVCVDNAVPSRAEQLKLVRKGVPVRAVGTAVDLEHAGDAAADFSFMVGGRSNVVVAGSGADGRSAGRAVRGAPSLLDRWILSRLADVTATARERLDVYDVAGAARPLERFVDDLSLWYVRRGRRRYWKSEADADKQAAYDTLYRVLVTLSKVLAPFLPFLSEALYQNLVRTVEPQAPASVHLCDFPTADAAARDPGLEAAMQQTRHLVYLGRAARNDAKIKVRQPLASATLLDRSGSIAGRAELIDLLKDELNVREVRFADSLRDLGRLEVRPRFDLLGPKFGGRITAIADALRAQGEALVEQTPEGEPYRVRVPGVDEIVLERAEVDVRMRWRDGHAGAGEGGAWVVLDTTVTDDLAREGLARELVHQVQQMRKEAGLEIADRITLYYEGDDRLPEVLRAHGDNVLREVLAVGASAGVPADGVHRKSVRLDGQMVTLGIAREQGAAPAARR